MILSILIASICINLILVISNIFKTNKLESRVYDLTVDYESSKKSTHQIQYVGANQDGQVKVSEDFKDFESEIDQFNKEYTKEFREKMPFFASEEEDLQNRGL